MLVLIVFGVLALVAFLGAIVGYYIGARHAAAEITTFFRRMIPSASNNYFDSITALLVRRLMLTDVSLWQIAYRLYWVAAEQARFSEPKPACSMIMKRADDGVALLADTGFRVWHAPFRAADLLKELQARGYRIVPETRGLTASTQSTTPEKSRLRSETLQQPHPDVAGPLNKCETIEQPPLGCNGNSKKQAHQ